MTDLNKTNNIVQNVQIAPVNNASNGYTPGQYINFRIGKGQMSQWLTNSSYLTFDITLPVSTFTGNVATTTTVTGVNGYIRDANMIFNQVEVLYAGNKIYSNVFNCETNMIKYLKLGDSYLNSNFNTFTTKKMITDGTVHLKYPGAAGTFAATTIANVIIPINQLCPIFEDISSDGFALGSLTEQLEFRFYVANPSQFLSFYGNDVFSATPAPTSSSGDFVTYWKSSTAALAKIPTPSTCTISNPQLNCYYFIPNDDYSNYLQSVNGPGGNGTIYRYGLWQVNTRNHTFEASTNSNLPFSVVTENTKSLLVYMHATDSSPSVTTRPSVSNVYTMFGNNLIPKQPLSGNTFENPGQYKFIIDDVYDMLDTYYSTTNSELTRSYTYGENTAGHASGANSSGFILVAGNYVNDIDELGSNSSAWNSQYQLLFNTGADTTLPFDVNQTIVFAVKSEYGMIIKDNSVQTYNL